MTTKHLLDPDLQVIAETIPEIKFSTAMLPKFRAARAKEVVMGDPQQYGVQRRSVSFSHAGVEVSGLLYQPEQSPKTPKPQSFAA